MRSAAARIAIITLAALAISTAIGLYVYHYLHAPKAVSTVKTAPRRASLVLGTTPAAGSVGGSKSWVSYLVRQNGQWGHTTVFTVPAHSLIHVTIYNFDGASALRNPYLARPQGMVGNHISVDGKSVDSIDPNDASHTFAVPALGLILAIPGVADDAKNQCGYAPCPMSNAHRTIKFTFHTTTPGHYRWQCFVPCAAGWIDGFGGPMQTIGYMDGFLNVRA